MTQAPTAPTPAAPLSTQQQTLALLERIALSCEATAVGLAQLREEVTQLRIDQGAAAEAFAAGQHAAQLGPAIVPIAQAASFVGHGAVDFQGESIVMTTGDDGAPCYKIKGFPFVKFGVRVWPEVLPLLGLDAAKLKPGTNAFAGVVRAVLNEDGKPKKVIGLAQIAQIAQIGQQAGTAG